MLFSPRFFEGEYKTKSGLTQPANQGKPGKVRKKPSNKKVFGMKTRQENVKDAEMIESESSVRAETVTTYWLWNFYCL